MDAELDTDVADLDLLLKAAGVDPATLAKRGIASGDVEKMCKAYLHVLHDLADQQARLRDELAAIRAGVEALCAEGMAKRAPKLVPVPKEKDTGSVPPPAPPPEPYVPNPFGNRFWKR